MKKFLGIVVLGLVLIQTLALSGTFKDEEGKFVLKTISVIFSQNTTVRSIIITGRIYLIIPEPRLLKFFSFIFLHSKLDRNLVTYYIVPMINFSLDELEFRHLLS
jgi:hypothetical protein